MTLAYLWCSLSPRFCQSKDFLCTKDGTPTATQKDKFLCLSSCPMVTAYSLCFAAFYYSPVLWHKQWDTVDDACDKVLHCATRYSFQWFSMTYPLRALVCKIPIKSFTLPNTQNLLYLHLVTKIASLMVSIITQIQRSTSEMQDPGTLSSLSQGSGF